MLLKSINTLTVSVMLGFTLVILLALTSFLEFPQASKSSLIPKPQKDSTFISRTTKSTQSGTNPFQDLLKAFNLWDQQVGCAQFIEKHRGVLKNSTFLPSSLQEAEFDSVLKCDELKMKHVTVLVKGWTWIPDNLDNLWYCKCGMSCLWTKSEVLADKPDALLFETSTPPLGADFLSPRRNAIFIRLHVGDTEENEQMVDLGNFQHQISYHLSLPNWYLVIQLFYLSCVYCQSSPTLPFELIPNSNQAFKLHIWVKVLQLGKLQQRTYGIRRRGDPLRIYMDLEAGRKKSGYEDIFVSYHAKDDVQSTYAGALFHNNRNFQLSPFKRNDTLVYWSSSRCLPKRNKLARSILSLLPHHSFGKCLNNVGGMDMALSYYPQCIKDLNAAPKWWDHLHCAMSHYKFVLAIENTFTESYVTEKLFYALDSGSVPIYFGSPNVWDFVPPNSIIDGSKFSSMQELASYVKAVANDPVAYAEYHAWRRCGVLGNYGKARAVSLDTLPCRLCEAVSRKDGRNAAL
ncbi:hypothetical protein Leryth_004508 [Lithospermum erythrorhizon]|nr:hypothetical protein Leryth_004508 [Lithospermum erythrorhizon]